MKVKNLRIGSYFSTQNIIRFFFFFFTNYIELSCSCLTLSASFSSVTWTQSYKTGPCVAVPLDLHFSLAAVPTFKTLWARKEQNWDSKPCRESSGLEVFFFFSLEVGILPCCRPGRSLRLPVPWEVFLCFDPCLLGVKKRWFKPRAHGGTRVGGKERKKLSLVKAEDFQPWASGLSGSIREPSSMQSVSSREQRLLFQSGREHSK